MVLWFLCREPFTLIHIFSAVAVISLITNALIWWLGSSVIAKPSLRLRRESLRYLIRESFPLGIAEAVRINYLRAGNLVLWIFHKYKIVSSFGIPYQIIEQLKFIPGSIRPAIFPAMCRLATGNRKGFEWTYNFLMRLLVVIALPLGLMLMAASGLILTFYTEDPTNEAINAMRVLSFLIIISFPSLVIRNIFVALGKQKLDTIISTAALIALVILLLALVPTHKVYGAVGAIFVAETFLFALGIFFVYRLGFRLDRVAPSHHPDRPSLDDWSCPNSNLLRLFQRVDQISRLIHPRVASPNFLLGLIESHHILIVDPFDG